MDTTFSILISQFKNSSNTHPNTSKIITYFLYLKMINIFKTLKNCQLILSNINNIDDHNIHLILLLLLQLQN